jgi:zinc transporter ZupT
MSFIFGILSFLISLIAGIAGMRLHGKLTRDAKILLAFSGAYLLALAVLHLLPEIYLHIPKQAGLYILAGFILQMILDYFSRGVEHGHIHAVKSEKGHFPWGVFLSLFIHSLIEGLPLTGEVHHHDHAHGIQGEALFVGIMIHKIPEALALAALLKFYLQNNRRVVFYIIIYALATPLGIFLGSWSMSAGFEDTGVLFAKILAIAVGIFLHVSTTVIFEADESHRLSWKKALAIALGLGIVLIL